MSAVRYICVSDLHLGAPYSILTHIDGRPDEAVTDHTQPGESLQAWAEALRAYVTELSPPEPPTLILLGDVLDMAFSSVVDTAVGFQHFVKALYPDDASRLFADDIIVVPGNHDHHLWEMAKDRLFLQQMTAIGAIRNVAGLISQYDTVKGLAPARFEVTALFPDTQLESLFLSSLLNGVPGLQGITVRIAYPNLGFVDDRDAPTRAVLLHHGHFTESLYRMMSTVSEWLNPGFELRTVEQLERQNGAWVDFLWSSLGDAGAVGGDALALYETMQNPAGARDMSRRLADRLADKVVRMLPFHGVADVHTLVTRIAEVAMDASLGRASELERNSFATVLSADGIAGLEWYLTTPLALQLSDALNGAMPADLSFVFGHTHKPFEDFVVCAGARGESGRPVRVFNTGGWVLDEPGMPPTQGAAAVFIDDALSVASLRLFNSPVNESRASVSVRTCGAGAANPLAEQMRAALTATHAQWEHFSDVAADAMRRRSTMLTRRFFDPSDNPPVAAGGEGTP